jgi:acetyl esterase/lipase
MNEGTFRVECDRALQYAVHDGGSLAGDFYKPAGTTDAPVVIAVHGGAWKVGDTTDFQYWGAWLASRGIAVYSITYRLVRGDNNRYPAAVLDVRAAVQFVRANASQLGIDPARIALMGAARQRARISPLSSRLRESSLLLKRPGPAIRIKEQARR